jgi:hypothetical protein
LGEDVELPERDDEDEDPLEELDEDPLEDPDEFVGWHPVCAGFCLPIPWFRSHS